MRLCIRLGAVCALVLLASSDDSAHTTSTANIATPNGSTTTAKTAATSGGPGARSAKSPSPSVTTSGPSRASQTSWAPSNATCRSRTVNYITHTLPQQCLRSRSESAPATDMLSAHTTSRAPDPGDGEVASGSSREGVSSPSATPSPVEPTSMRVAPGPALSSPPTEAEADAESPLDNANFLSFEDWKKQNLEKAGQSPEHVAQGRGGAVGAPSGRKRPDVGSLESLGEEGEIDFDFGGFVGMDKPSGSPSAGSEASSVTLPGSGEASEAVQVPTSMRSKDAGKTCKERYNYASFDCAATVLKTNPQCKSATSVLVENKDSYMLNECGAANKFLIMELCDHIIVDTVVLANFEFFSSMVRTFSVSVSDRYPPKPGQWIELGTFEARNSREIQAFLVEGPRVWARYVRLEFLTHYGNEYYCPVSLLRVHGITMMEEYKHEEERARGEMEQEEQGIEEAAGGAERVVTADVVARQAAATATVSAQNCTAADGSSTGDATPTWAPSFSGNGSNAGSAVSGLPDEAGRGVAHDEHTNPQDSGTSASADSVGDPASSHGIAAGPPTLNGTQPDASSQGSGLTGHGAESTVGLANSTNTESTAAEAAATQQTHSGRTIANTKATDPARPMSADSSWTDIHPAPPSIGATDGTGPTSPTVGERVRASSSWVAQAAVPSPSTQESFFKSVDKRLKALESNATLSLQYIEEQSRILRDAFSKVEKRQLSKTETFLAHLNTTVMAELRSFRAQYDQLWQSTVLELETHQEQYEREIHGISSRLGLLADEVVFQKRMVVVQSTLLMLCLGFLLFARPGTANLELPLMQSAGSRGRELGTTVPYDSPSGSPHRASPPDSGPPSERRSRFARFFRPPGPTGSSGSSSGSSSSSSSSTSPASTRTRLVARPAPTPSNAAGAEEDGGPQARDESGESLPEDEDDHQRHLPPSAAASGEGGESSDADGDRTAHARPRPRHVRSGPATPQGTRDRPLGWDAEPECSIAVPGSGEEEEDVT